MGESAERGSSGRVADAAVLEEEDVAGALADEGVEVAVAVNVGELGRGSVAYVGEPEDARARGGEGWCTSLPVFSKKQVCRPLADKRVEVAIVVVSAKAEPPRRTPVLREAGGRRLMKQGVSREGRLSEERQGAAPPRGRAEPALSAIAPRRTAVRASGSARGCASSAATASRVSCRARSVAPGFGFRLPRWG